MLCIRLFFAFVSFPLWLWLPAQQQCPLFHRTAWSTMPASLSVRIHWLLAQSRPSLVPLSTMDRTIHFLPSERTVSCSLLWAERVSPSMGFPLPCFPHSLGN